MHLHFRLLLDTAQHIRISMVLNLEQFTLIIRINLQGKIGQRHQINAVIILQCRQISISGTNSNHIGNTGRLSGSGSHPEQIMIPPLNIHRMVIHQMIHDFHSTRASVINIAHNMQMIDNQTLNQLA